MNILFTIGTLSGGGSERVIARLSTRLVKMGHRVSVFLIANDRVEYAIDHRVNVKYITPKVNVTGIRGLSRMLEYRREVKRLSPDVVIAFTAPVNVFVMRALKGLQLEIILSERNNPYVDPARSSARRTRDRLYRKADGIVFQTEDARNYFPEKIRSRSTVIMNPIDESIPDVYIGEHEKRIVTVGRLEPQKNQRMLITAFAKIADRYPDYTLEIYGKGRLEDELRAFIDELGLADRVRLMGHTTTLLDTIRKADLFVLPSDFEGISNALIEAMALGLPSISTDHPIGGARALIRDGENGVLTPVGNADAFAEAIDRVLSDAEFKNKISVNAVDVREALSIEKITDEWLEFIDVVKTS